MTRRSSPNGRCRVCRHPDRGRIELLAAAGASRPVLGRKFGMSDDSIQRHMARHVTPERRAQLALGPVSTQALASAVAEESESVLDNLRVVRAGLYNLYAAACEAGDRLGGAVLAGRLHENLRTVAKITGELANSPLIQHTHNTVNLLGNDPRFAQFQLDLVRALSGFPDALKAVTREFERIECAALPAIEHQHAA